MSIRNLSRIISFALPCAGAIAACSLTVPDEDELFGGGSPGTAGKGGDTQGGSSASGSSSGGAGTNAGGADAGGPPGGGGQAAAGEGGGDNGEPGGAGAGAGGEPGVVLPPADLLLHYTFDDLSELVAEDASGNGLHGTISGDSLPGGATGHIDGAISLNVGSALKQHVAMPDDILLNRPAVSVTAWLRLSQAAVWDRLFDFNAGSANTFYFSPTGWNVDKMGPGSRCALNTSSSGLAPEIMLTETVPVNAWHHIAIVLAKPYLRYYLDGVLEAELDTLTFGSSALGSTNNNWIGRSSYATDPYLSGLVDDFRIYTGALTAEEIAELAAQ